MEPVGQQVINVLIADDHALVRHGLKLMVASVLGDVRFLDAYDAASLLLKAGAAPPPHLALIDLNMPGMDRGSRLIELTHAYPALPIVVISALTSPDIVRRSLAMPNVFAFVPKSASSAHLGEAIAAALKRVKMPFAQVMPSDTETSVKLSPRLEEVRHLLHQGMSNKLIAVELGISEGTVKNYMSDIFKALNVSNRTQAAQFDPDSA
jgi:DNA-binding NarL/FixJ family response regulator